MLSIAIAFPLVLAKIPEAAMMQIFLYGGGMGSDPTALAIFLGGLHQAFFIGAAISIVAAVASAVQPAHKRADAHAATSFTPAVAEAEA
jgi:hypothetical protein